MRIVCVKGETLKTTAGQGAQALGWEKTKRIYSNFAARTCTHFYSHISPLLFFLMFQNSN